MTHLRGKLRFISGETRLCQCSKEPANNPPLNELLAKQNGNPDDIRGATNYIKGQGYQEGACVEVGGNSGTIGGVRVFYLVLIASCPNAA